MAEARRDVGKAVLRVSEMASLFTPWALRAAVTLRIPDLIAEGATGLGTLAAGSGTDPDALRRLLSHLANLGIVREAGSGHWELTGLGDVLTATHPARLADRLDQSNPLVRRGDRAVHGLLHSVRTGSPAWSVLHGRSYWEDLEADIDVATAFDESMADHATRLGRRIAVIYDWTPVRDLVDVGGRTGGVLAEVLRHHGGLRGTLVDLPATVERAGPALADLRDRATIVGQSFFDPLPRRGDVYLLVHVIHDWPDEECVKILRRCAQATGPGGRVLVVEKIVAHRDDTTCPTYISERDMAMLLMLGGKERSEDEFRRIGERAGLSLLNTTLAFPQEGLFLLEYLTLGETGRRRARPGPRDE